MKRTTLTTALSAPALLLAMHAAHAAPQAHVVCGYSHTLGDDAIMMFGRPNEAMLHDFFGNTHTDSRRGYHCWRGITMVQSLIRISRSYVLTAKVTRQKQAKCAGYARRETPCSLISVFSFPTAGMA